MRRRFFWGMVAVAVTTLLVGGLAPAALISRSGEASARAEFARQAAATGRLLEADLPAGALGEGRARLIQILRDVALVGGHDFVEAAVVGPRGAVTPLGEGGVLLDQVPGIADLASAVAFDAEVDGRKVTAVAQPIRLGRLQAATRRLAGGDLTARVPVEGGDELGEMAVAFNDMAGQLEEARRREREFLVAVGHDLRTPLTTIGGYAEAMGEGRIGSGDIAR